ncbi:MAG: sensor protein [Gemmatimonadetes bacterium]|nr:sensor protein [Gemmatimonadota bacterium]
MVIATEAHRRAFAKALKARGIKVDRARMVGQLTALDARATLDQFMVDGIPDAEKFRATIAPVVERSRALAAGGAILAYGEMVDLLWKDDNPAGAIRLESLWNELSADYEFSLLCAYAMGNFTDAAHSEDFQAICGTHSRVLPTEGFAEQDEGARLVEITLLQQRAKSLSTEVARREGLQAELLRTVDALRAREEELRVALENRDGLLELERAAPADAEKARLLAEQANRAKGQFLAVMSHELRTPLNAIGGYAELLDMGIQGPVTNDQREALERIQRSQRHLLGLINQVLNYARVESGTLRYELADVPVGEALRGAEALVLPQLSSKGLHYSFAGCDPSILVRADQEKLQQVILNLLTNATKFTDPGGRIMVECECRGAKVLIGVRDTGIGIPPEKVDAIFDPFVQVDNNYTRTRDGIGLGLAISRALARAMGGDLTVESFIGYGSTFTLALPRSG